MGKGKIHYIEVVSNSEDEMDEEGSGAIYNIGMCYRTICTCPKPKASKARLA